MAELPAIASLTTHERGMLANMLSTVAGGGSASYSVASNAGEKNHAFLNLLTELVDAGVVDQRGTQPSRYAAKTTGTLTAASGSKDELRQLAAAAREGNLQAAFAAATSAEAIADRVRATSAPPTSGTAPSVASDTSLADATVATADPAVAAADVANETNQVTLAALRDAFSGMTAARRLQAAQAFANALPNLSDLILQAFATPGLADDRPTGDESGEAA